MHEYVRSQPAGETKYLTKGNLNGYSMYDPMRTRKIFLYVTIVLFAAFLAVVAFLFHPLSVVKIIRIVIGAVASLFLPGYIWSFILFQKKTINLIERVLISVVFSLIIISFLPFFLNLVGLPLTTEVLVVEILGAIALGIAARAVLTNINALRHRRS